MIAAPQAQPARPANLPCGTVPGPGVGQICPGEKRSGPARLKLRSAICNFPSYRAFAACRDHGGVSMEATVRAPSIQVLEPDEDVLGEVPIAPYGLTGVSEAQLARTLSRPSARRRPAPTRELPHSVHRPTPYSPLSMRLAGLAALMRR